MNKSYKTVWNETSGTYVAAPEGAKGRGKKSSAGRVVAFMAVVGTGLAAVTPSVSHAAQWIGNTEPCAYGVSNGSAGTLTATGGGSAAANASAVDEGIAFGSGASAGTCGASNGVYAGWAAIAMGTHAVASGGGLALGYGANGAGIDSIAIGPASGSTGRSSVALGAGANDNGRSNVVSVGLGGSAVQPNPTGSGSKPTQGAVPVTRQVINMAAGVQATDAVNVSQLSGVTDALGGGATINSDGSIKAPSYKVQGGTYSNVGDALTGLDTGVTSVTNTVTNIMNGGGIKYFHTNSTLADSSATGTDAVAIGGNASASAKNSVALGSGSTTTANLSAAGYNPGSLALSGTASAANGEVSVGATGKERRVTNVAAGSAATDAVNVSQLQSEDAKVNTINNNVNNLSNNVSNIAGNVTNINNTVNNLSNNVSNIAGDVTNINNTVNNITNGGGIKYFHTNSTLADSSATGTDAVAIGGNASASAKNSVALGSGSTTTANLSAAGYNPGTAALSGTASTANGEVSMGASGKERRVTNVAAGSAATDAVNVSQLQSEDAKVNTINNNVNNLSNIGASYQW